MSPMGQGQCARRSAGFTLIELLVSAAIVSLLAVIATPNLLGAKDKAKRAACDSNYTLLAPEIITQMDSLEGDPEKAEKSVSLVVPRHNASGGGPSAGGDPNPRDRREDAFVDKGECGSFVPTPGGSCQVFLCYSGADSVMLMQHESGNSRTFRIVH